MADDQESTGGVRLVLEPTAGDEMADAGTLSLRYVDGVPLLVVTGGTVIPTQLFLLGDDGRAVAVYNLSYERPERSISTSTLPDRQLVVGHNGFFPCDVK